MFEKRPKDGDEGLIYGTHVGDYGVVLVAALITLVMVGVLVLPSPFARLENAQAQQDKAERQKVIDKAVATGEVSVSITPSKKH
jgi:hypothetical protein